MRRFLREFPPKRRHEAKRGTERRIFEALATSDLAGFPYCKWRRDFHDGEVDFAIWVEGTGYAAL